MVKCKADVTGLYGGDEAEMLMFQDKKRRGTMRFISWLNTHP